MKPIPSLKLVHTCSAYSTLLLDDSPAKAVLQPLNHLCIPEYTSTQFASDTEHARLLRGVSQDKRLQRLRNQIEEQRQNPAPDAQTPEDEAKARKLAKGKAKKLAKLEERSKAHNMNLDVPAPGAQFDETLLAVVGVLDTVRWQSNVSSWIKDGGLLGRPSDDQVALGDRSPPAAEQPPSEHNLWFDDPEVFRLWVQKGRETLTGLHIHLGAGVP
ncbi:hypothetical protein ONZ45_g8823 [Pleurotus djamor]|nr:hypothetical protein ONZ45_g8823 [Pleurotus djamor]